MLLWSVIVACLCHLSYGQTRPDPLCIEKNCPSKDTCRIEQVCVSGSCNLRAVCLERPPRHSHVGVCLLGDPILVKSSGRGGALEDNRCGQSNPCLNGTYCNTELMDTYATCCLSDPDKPVKPGSCPPNTYHNDEFCLDTCNNDGDCRQSDKCCNHGCNRECIPPAPPTPPPHPCDDKTCPPDHFCQIEQDNCSRPGQCYEPGQCAPCPPLCEIGCEFGNVKDPNGCPVCECLPKPPPMPCGPVCQIYCEHGNIMDANGCPTCACNKESVAKMAVGTSEPEPEQAAEPGESKTGDVAVSITPRLALVIPAAVIAAARSLIW